MPDFVKIGGTGDMPDEGEAKEFPVGDKVVCVACIDGQLSAIDNVCLHRGGPLGGGVIVDGKVVCPWHGWMWDPKTGAAAQAPEVKVAVYPLKVEGDGVFVQL